jgi:hypothetical protein
MNDVASREERGESEDAGSGQVTAERLSSLGDWEMYRLLDEDALEPVCSVALRPGAVRAAVEYGVWREHEDGEEPGTTGTIEWPVEAKEWGDGGREDVLRQVVYRYEEDLGIDPSRLAFRFEGPPEGDDDENEEGDEDDDDDEEDSDEDDEADGDDEA